MSKASARILLAASLALSSATLAFAQAMEPMEHGAMGHESMEQGAAGAAAPALPAACTAAARSAPAAMPPMGEASAAGVGVQAANTAALEQMHAPMAAAATIEDPDLAFNCGMIAHHRGAIAMAQVELAMGRDAASKALAEEIVAAQKKEIAAMTSWIENYKPQ